MIQLTLKIIALAFLMQPLASCDKENNDGDIPQRVSGTHDIIPLPKRVDFFDNQLQLDDLVRNRCPIIRKFGVGNISGTFLYFDWMRMK